MSEPVNAVETQARLRTLAEKLGLTQDECLNVLLNHYELTLKAVPRRTDFQQAFAESLEAHGHVLNL